MRDRQLGKRAFNAFRDALTDGRWVFHGGTVRFPSGEMYDSQHTKWASPAPLRAFTIEVSQTGVHWMPLGEDPPGMTAGDPAVEAHRILGLAVESHDHPHMRVRVWATTDATGDHAAEAEYDRYDR